MKKMMTLILTVVMMATIPALPAFACDHDLGGVDEHEIEFLLSIMHERQELLQEIMMDMLNDANIGMSLHNWGMEIDAQTLEMMLAILSASTEKADEIINSRHFETAGQDSCCSKNSAAAQQVTHHRIGHVCAKIVTFTIMLCRTCGAFWPETTTSRNGCGVNCTA